MSCLFGSADGVGCFLAWFEPDLMIDFWPLFPTPKVASCLKGVTTSKSLEELARRVAQVQGQLAGKEEDSETSDENELLPVPKSSRVGRHHRLRKLVDHSMCRDGRSEESILKR